MKRLFLLIVFLAVSVGANAAKMSSYTNNTTPNSDVYFVGVDPNDTTQTINGSNYRYSINSIMGLGLIDAVFNSLSVTGTGDSWLELNNNAFFSGSLVGKYGYSFLTANPTAIINGTASRLALYSELAAGDTSVIQDDDPTLASATGKYYSRASGGYFNVVHGVEMFALAGTRTADETDPVIGDITPSALTHDGTGVSLSATIASVTEPNEDKREWSLYDVTAGAIVGGWTTFTGLSITGITIPADQHSYRLDVRCTDLAGNVGTASSANIAYSAGACEDTQTGGFVENFEATGYDSPTWTESVPSGGNVDEDNTSGPIRGSQSLLLVGANTAAATSSRSITAASELWCHFAVKFVDATPTSSASFFFMRAGSTSVCYVDIRTDGNLRYYNGSIYLTTTTPIFSDATTKHIWLHYIAGTGANGQTHVYVSDTVTRPASPSYSVTNGNATGSVDVIRPSEYNGVTSGTRYDQIIVSTVEIGDVCE